MPRNLVEPKRLQDLSLQERKAHPIGGQDHWYLTASQFVKGLSVLDVGAADGRGLCILALNSPSKLTGIDPLPLSKDQVFDLPIGDLRDNSFDIVTSMDVLEHVENDVGFLQDLLRVARLAVFISTPCWSAWECKNPFHVREYLPEELTDLFKRAVGPTELAETAGAETPAQSAPPIFTLAMWTSGKNRELEPPIRISTLQEATASYGLLIRASECSDEQWQSFLQAPRIIPGLPENMARLGRSAEEWTAYFSKMVEGKTPLQATVLLIEQVQSLVAQVSVESPIPPNDAIKILRYGQANPNQQKVLLSWLLNTFVFNQSWPYVGSK